MDESHPRIGGDVLRAPQTKPFLWNVSDGVLFAELPAGAALRPPLLTEWESERVRQFKDARRRNDWISGRALAKLLVRDRLGIGGIVEIRDGEAGEPVVVRNGLPMLDLWVSIINRNDRVAAVISNRAVALDFRRIDAQSGEIARRFVRRDELLPLRRAFDDIDVAATIAWAVKEAAVRALRAPGASPSLHDVTVGPSLDVTVAGERYRTLALRIVDDAVLAIVGRPNAEGITPPTRILADRLPQSAAATEEASADATDAESATKGPGIAARTAMDAVDEQVSKAKSAIARMMRIQRIRWQQG